MEERGLFYTLTEQLGRERQRYRWKLSMGSGIDEEISASKEEK